MFVVMRRHEGRPVAEGHAPESGVYAAALPLSGGEPAEEGERFPAPPSKGGQRQTGIVAQILPFLDPSFRVERGPFPVAHPPFGRITGHIPQGKELGVVHRQHRAKSKDELLFNVPQMAQDFFGRPRLAVRLAGQGSIVLAANRGGQLVRCTFQTLQALFQVLTQVFFPGGHLAFLSIVGRLRRL